MSTVQRTRTYAVCPACGADAGQVDHLLGQTLETAWYCDACGQRYRLKFANGSVQIETMAARKVTTVDVLVLPPQEKPVYFIVEGMRFEGEGDDDGDEYEHKRFYYMEHSCPTNWLKPDMVYFDGDTDPHGLIEFVATKDEADFPADEPYGPNDRDLAVQAFVEEQITLKG